MKKVLTLCLVCDEGKILLGMKKRGFGVGRWNGFGGKVEEGESIEAAAVRELKEEIGLVPLVMEKVGIVSFSFLEDPKEPEVHIFRVTRFDGTPVETEEMSPRWFSYEKIPYEEMWSGDKDWFPYAIEGRLFSGAITFDRPSDATYAAKVISSSIVCK